MKKPTYGIMYISGFIVNQLGRGLEFFSKSLWKPAMSQFNYRPTYETVYGIHGTVNLKPCVIWVLQLIGTAESRIFPTAGCKNFSIKTSQ